MTTETNECREAFEQWYLSEVDTHADFNWDAQGYYYNVRINTHWETWQAAAFCRPKPNKQQEPKP